MLGGTNAIGDAFRNIRDGYLDVTIAGGCELKHYSSWLLVVYINEALSESHDPKRASIPFDKKKWFCHGRRSRECLF